MHCQIEPAYRRARKIVYKTIAEDWSCAFEIFASETETVGVWGTRAPRLEIVRKSGTLSVDLDKFLARLS